MFTPIVAVSIAFVVTSALVVKLDADMRKQHLEMQFGTKKEVKE